MAGLNLVALAALAGWAFGFGFRQGAAAGRDFDRWVRSVLRRRSKA